MKKGVLIISIILLLSLSLIVAQGNNLTDIDKAYNCLETRVQGNCASLGPQERIFSLLAIGECQDAVISDLDTSFNLKSTAQAILALSKATSYNTQSKEEWLLSQNTSPSDVEWYLQIESDEETRCVISYQGMDHTLILKEDKTFNTGAKPCLRLSNDDLWLKISPTCYDDEFKISCDESFQTNLLFKKEKSSIVFVSDITHGATGEGTTTEKVNSACFIQDGECNYEGSLWAAMVLKYKGHDVGAFMPYLTSNSEDYSEYLPESFLYLLTGQDDYRNTLLSNQKGNNKYWEIEGDKFYGTALALYSISDKPPEKINSEQWLLEVQDEDGCWQGGNIRNTAFILASIWPRTIEVGVQACEPLNGYCMAEANCEGNILSSYSCPGTFKCCDTQAAPKTCAEQLGEICSSEEVCRSGILVDATDTEPGEKCCTGTCEMPSAPSECELYNGNCRMDCHDDETIESYLCDFPGDVCCVPGKEPGYAWIIILIILIILVVLGIIFRNKIRPYWNKLISKFKRRGPPTAPAPRGPLARPGMPVRRHMPRKVLPPIQRAPATRPKPAKKPGELGDVLKKLKEMSK